METCQIIELGHGLMTRWGVVQRGWTLRIGKAKRQWGSVNFRTKTLTISGTLAALNPDQVEDTILHEIAHIRAGVHENHGAAWVHECLIVGANPERTAHIVAKPVSKWIGTCPGCERVIPAHRRDRRACGVCCRKHNGGKFNADYLFTWSDNPVLLENAAL